MSRLPHPSQRNRYACYAKLGTQRQRDRLASTAIAGISHRGRGGFDIAHIDSMTRRLDRRSAASQVTVAVAAEVALRRRAAFSRIFLVALE